MMNTLETVANTFGHFFGLDFYIGKWCRWTDLKEYSLGFERDGRDAKFWFGPLHIAMSRA